MMDIETKRLQSDLTGPTVKFLSPEGYAVKKIPGFITHRLLMKGH